ncbi:hypothetical protein EDC01DRAFT_635858 [Geopyxis carbonaria]|nr:hypothetical protein EDC01DRAFT_635858 [Geopyxis carbonaria]
MDDGNQLRKAFVIDDHGRDQNDHKNSVGQQEKMGIVANHEVQLGDQNPAQTPASAMSNAGHQLIVPAAVAMATAEFYCTIEGCNDVFGSYGKMRRHRNSVEHECPLCPPHGKLWKRVEKIQEHLLKVHFPFVLELVRPTVDAMYRTQGGGRGWYEKVEALLLDYQDRAKGIPH